MTHKNYYVEPYYYFRASGCWGMFGPEMLLPVYDLTKALQRLNKEIVMLVYNVIWSYQLMKLLARRTIMANYLLLYSGGRMPESEAEQAAVMQAWMSWFGQLGNALVDGGNPTSGQAKTIASNGTVSEGSELGMASGYSIIKADSLDEAVAKAKGCPVLQGGAKIVVLETFNVM